MGRHTNARGNTELLQSLLNIIHVGGLGGGGRGCEDRRVVEWMKRSRSSSVNLKPQLASKPSQSPAGGGARPKALARRLGGIRDGKNWRSRDVLRGSQISSLFNVPARLTND